MKGGGKERESEFIMSPACSVGVTMGVFTSVNMFTSVCLCACVRVCAAILQTAMATRRRKT